MKKSITKNFVYNLSYEILSMIIPFITAPYLTRILNAANMGTYTYSHSITNYFLLISMLGFSMSGNRIIAKTRNDKEKLNLAFSSVYFAQFITSVTIVILFYLYCIIMHHEIIYYVLGLFVISSIFNICWLYNGYEEFKFTAIVNAVFKLLSFVLIFVCVKNENDLIVYALIMSGIQLLTNLTIFIFHGKIAKFVKPQKDLILNYWREALVLFLPVISASVYKIMDKIMIGSITGDMIGVSNYYYAEQLIGIPSSVVIALSAVVLPRMSYKFSIKDEKVFSTLSNNIIMIAFFIACAIAFGLSGVANIFVPLYLGNEYIQCGNYVVTLSIVSLIITWTTMMRTLFLLPMNKDKSYTISVVLGAVVNVIVNAILIRPMGVTGAIIGTILAELTVALIQTKAVIREIPLKKTIFNIMPFIFTGVGMAIICRSIGIIMGRSWITLIVQIIIGATVYLLVSIFLVVKFHKNNLNELKSEL